MIPERVKEQLKATSLSLVVGTRDAELTPHFTRVYFAKVNEDNESITFYAPTAIADTMLADIKDNGKVAFQSANILNFNTFQLKGTLLKTYMPSDEENSVIESYHEEMSGALTKIGLTEQLWRGLVAMPTVAVSFKVEDVFIQTPGKGAGEKFKE